MHGESQRPSEIPRRVRIGDYLILGRWATGGMSHVYVAKREPDDGRLYAVKTLRDEYSEDEQFRDMFETEAHIAALWSHPNVVQTRDIVREHRRLYIVMDFVAGETLRSVLDAAKRDGSFPIIAAVEIAMRLAEALYSGHTLCDERGHPLSLVHRDVCPANIMIDHEGRVMLLDFGIAKAASRAIGTQAFQVKGHIAYVSPEQAAGARDVDYRSDIFSLGLVLWELLTLRPAVNGSTEAEIVYAAAHGRVPPPSTCGVNIPMALDGILKKMLMHDRRQRFQDAGELARGLRDLFQEEGSREKEARSVMRAFMWRHFGKRRTETKSLLERWERLAREASPMEQLPSNVLGSSPWATPPDYAVTEPGGPPNMGSTSEPIVIDIPMNDSSLILDLPPPRSLSQETFGSLPIPAPVLSRRPHANRQPPPPPPREAPLYEQARPFDDTSSLTFDIDTNPGIASSRGSGRERALLVLCAMLFVALVCALSFPRIAGMHERVLSVASDPSGATVLVDGRLIGKTPLRVVVPVDVPVNVVLEHDDYELMHVPVDSGSQDLRVEAPLSRRVIAKVAPVAPVIEEPKIEAKAEPKPEPKQEPKLEPKKLETKPKVDSLDSAMERAVAVQPKKAPTKIAERKPAERKPPDEKPIEQKAAEKARHSSSQPVELEMGRPMVTGKIDQAAVAELLTQAETKLKTCYQSAVAEATFSGHLRLQIVIDGAGQTESVTTNMLGSQTFRECADKVVRGIKFPKPAAVGALVLVSLKLNSES